MIFLKKNKHIFLLLSACYCGLLFSCKQIDLYEKDTSIPKYEWQNTFEAKGSFTITDTIALYNLYLVLRHTDAYKYNNIWLNIGFQSPGDSMHYQKVDLLLATDASGWEGAGMNDIWEVRKIVNENPKPFKKPGIYNFSIAQIMRDNPLFNIMSAGLRIEKVSRN